MMTGNEKVRKENQALRNEIEELKENLQKLSQDVSSKIAGGMSPDRVQSIEFVSNQYDELVLFKDETKKQI